MALPAGARRAESTKVQSEAAGRAPVVPPSDPPNGTSTPGRPSASPSSTTTKPAPSSAIATKNTSMRTPSDEVSAAADRQLHELDAEASDLPDDRSSSLSEPEDDQDGDLQPNGMDDEDEEDEDEDDAQDREKSVDERPLEVDSEAETEPLGRTPQKSRKHQAGERKTPSKLSRTTAADEDLSEPPSPLLAGPGGASSTSTLATAGQKRKRMDATDSPLTSAESELGDSPRKRSHRSSAGDQIPDGTAVSDAGAEDDAAMADEDGIVADDIEASTETAEPGSRTSAKAGRGRRRNTKGKHRKGAVKDLDTEQDDGSAPLEEDPGEEATVLSAEELKHQEAASSVFDDLAKQFTAFREKLCNERLAVMTTELEMLNQPACQHPEYLRQVACVDARHAKQVGETEAFYRYRIESLRRTTLGERSQFHSQYFQYIRELREDVLYKLGEDWYRIQKERRQNHQDFDKAFIFKFPTKKSVQIRQQAKYNQEVSVLSGIAKYVGFPAAPEILGVEGDLLEEDLKAMKVPQRTQNNPTTVQSMYFPLNKSTFASGQDQTHSERLAQEQFFEQNSWARPQAPIPTHGTPNLTHTPDWAEPKTITSHKTLHRDVGEILHHVGGTFDHVSSPYVTPAPQRQTQPDPSSSGTLAVNSEPMDRSSHAPVGGSALEPSYENSSPTGAVSRPRRDSLPIAGFRAFSGASTIDGPPDSAEKDSSFVNRHSHSANPSETNPQRTLHIPIPRPGADGERPSNAYSNSSFRAHEGAFGTPAPLPAVSAAP